MNDIPVLRTERLVLRAHRADDLDAYTALWSDEEVVRFIGGKPFDRHECWSRILRARGMWALVGCGFWIVEDAASGQLLGEAGLMDAKRAIEPTLDGTLEAGWAFLPHAHGRGFARETMRAVLGWADTHFAGTPQSCIIGDDNARSIRLADLLGFRESARGDFHGSAVIHFRRQPPGE